MKTLLKNILNGFNSAISKTYLVGTISDQIFEDFPSKLPIEIRDNWREKMKLLLADVNSPKKSENYNFKDYGFFLSLIHTIPSGGEQSDFEQVILRKDLISYVAYLEALFQDVNRIIYKENPNYISGEKQISWNDILDKENYQEIVDFVIEKQLEKSGYDKLSKQIERLNNEPYLFKILIKKEKIKELELLVATRNLIIHNGNKITAEYLALCDNSTLNIGDKLMLSRDNLNDVHILIQKIAYETYASVGHKLFGIDKIELYNEMNYKPGK
ncbi:hypothetical protein D9O36_05995 [Zobellia amurskyensis]|uniref:RiboL-PSP-HEPN domain-containing protein n=1 Tax=Zobellia amurskyensis TaxID=248905 RepID=A0A7X2ZS81_9FLAO|nr:hypothetical protein [Zobellia amurskyensis]MUH35384.1 hypothetical protein [Zobellia amurskyensis]